MVQEIKSFILFCRDQREEGRFSATEKKSLGTGDLEYCLRVYFVIKLTFFFIFGLEAVNLSKLSKVK
jgi:hypothetical protein